MSFILIVLDNYPDVCYPGQTISGRVECDLKDETNFRGKSQGVPSTYSIRIKFKGRAKTKWSVRTSSGKNSNTVTYSAEENYFEAEYNLVEGGDGRQLSAGHHSYPFAYILPPELPSAFEGQYGNIRYYIRATVDRPWKLDYEYQVNLNVFSPLDLNYLPGLREPVAVSGDKTLFSCWCNNSGALTFNMSLPATGFVPGQAINIPSSVVNMTNVDTGNIRFKIKAEIEFIAHHPSTRRKHDSELVAEQIDGGVAAHGEKSWTSVLNIPTNKPIPNLALCKIINISYILEGEVVVPCPHTNLDVEIPVMIGTVPLSDEAATFYAGGPPLGVPYPPADEGRPFAPPVGFAALLAPYPSAGPSEMNGSTDAQMNFGLPSYDDVKEMDKNNEKRS